MLARLGEMMGGPPVGNFNVQLRCYSAAMFPGGNSQKIDEINNGGKILLPPSCLDWLTRLHVSYPMLFKLTNPKPDSQRVTHCGVLEFLAEEGKCHLPYWMMRHLLLEEGQIVQIEYSNIPVATYAKFKAQSANFVDIHDPKVVLEMKLRNFSCLTKGDIIALEYNNTIYELLVVQVKPGNAVSIIETDMNVEFDTPEGYVEPTPVYRNEGNTPGGSGSGIAGSDSGVKIDDIEVHEPSASGFVAFSGEGQRLDGKVKKQDQSGNSNGKVIRGAPDYDWKPGKLEFIREYKRMDVLEREKRENGLNFKPFEGSGSVLKKKR